jgi:hypothetical protein
MVHSTEIFFNPSPESTEKQHMTHSKPCNASSQGSPQKSWTSRWDVAWFAIKNPHHETNNFMVQHRSHWQPTRAKPYGNKQFKSNFATFSDKKKTKFNFRMKKNPTSTINLFLFCLILAITTERLKRLWKSITLLKKGGNRGLLPHWKHKNTKEYRDRTPGHLCHATLWQQADCR